MAASHHAFAGSPPAIMPSRVPTLALAPLHQHSHACHARAGTKWRPFCPVTPTAQHYRDEPPSLLTFAWMLLWQATNHNSSCSSHTMLHHTPKAYGSLGHDESSHQKKATVTKSNGLDLLKSRRLLIPTTPRVQRPQPA